MVSGDFVRAWAADRAHFFRQGRFFAINDQQGMARAEYPVEPALNTLARFMVAGSLRLSANMADDA